MATFSLPSSPSLLKLTYDDVDDYYVMAQTSDETISIVYHLSNRKRFLCLHSLIQTREGLGEFEAVMQNRDEVEGLHNRREFSQLLECLYQAMQTQEKVFYCFYKITFTRKNAKPFVWH